MSGGKLTEVDFAGPQRQDPTGQPGLLDDSLRDVLNYDAFAHVPAIPDVGRDLLDGLFNGGVDGLSLSADPFFNFDAFIEDHPTDLSNEASESTSSVQSQFGAPPRGSDEQGFAAAC